MPIWLYQRGKPTESFEGMSLLWADSPNSGIGSGSERDVYPLRLSISAPRETEAFGQSNSGCRDWRADSVLAGDLVANFAN